jgi:hypothetical protein
VAQLLKKFKQLKRSLNIAIVIVRIAVDISITAKEIGRRNAKYYLHVTGGAARAGDGGSAASGMLTGTMPVATVPEAATDAPRGPAPQTSGQAGSD